MQGQRNPDPPPCCRIAGHRSFSSNFAMVATNLGSLPTKKSYSILLHFTSELRSATHNSQRRPFEPNSQPLWPWFALPRLFIEESRTRFLSKKMLKHANAQGTKLTCAACQHRLAKQMQCSNAFSMWPRTKFSRDSKVRASG